MTPDQAMSAVLDRMAGPFIWGQSDCCTSASDVFCDLFGIDPMASLRGHYTTEAGAMTIIRANGGWRGMTRRCAAQAGLVDGRGAAGEIGLLKLPDRFVLAACVGFGQWAGRVDGGFTTDGNVVACWQAVRDR